MALMKEINERKEEASREFSGCSSKKFTASSSCVYSTSFFFSPSPSCSSSYSLP